MLALIEGLDAFCERLQMRMKIDPVPSGLEVEADELTARIKEVERYLPPGLSLGDWGRKTHFIRYYLARREPLNCESDLDVFREQNIPATKDALTRWGSSLAYFDEELRDAIKGLIRTREFPSAIRQAFVLLTERLRTKYGLKPGTDGPELVNQIFGTKSTVTTHMDPAERQSMRDYLAGAYGLLRNKYAHGSPPLDLTELEAALATVNLALKMLRSP